MESRILIAVAVFAVVALVLSLERIRQAILRLNRTIAHAEVAKVKAEMLTTVDERGSLGFERLSHRVRGGDARGEEAGDEEDRQ